MEDSQVSVSGTKVLCSDRAEPAQAGFGSTTEDLGPGPPPGTLHTFCIISRITALNVREGLPLGLCFLNTARPGNPWYLRAFPTSLELPQRLWNAFQPMEFFFRLGGSNLY